MFGSILRAVGLGGQPPVAGLGLASEPPAAGAPGGGAPRHLVVFVNGLFGSRANWRVLQGLIAAELGQGALLHAATANEFAQTFQGIDTCGERLAAEIEGVARQHPSLQSISIIGHSMGGLLSRYAIGSLYEPETGTLAGLRPRHYLAIATPHLGCDGAPSPAQVPFIGWVGAVPSLGLRAQALLGSLAAPVSSLAFARTGRQFFLEDEGEGGALPLLARMTADEPEEGLHFISGLRAFETRTLYANSSGDHLVGWANSSLRSLQELPLRTAKGRGVVREDPREDAWRTRERQGSNAAAGCSPEAEALEAGQEDTGGGAVVLAASSSSGSDELQGEGAGGSPDHRSRLLHVMLQRLQALPFRRVDVCFGATLLPFMSHQHIQVQRPLVNFYGMEAARHLARELGAMERELASQDR